MYSVELVPFGRERGAGLALVLAFVTVGRLVDRLGAGHDTREVGIFSLGGCDSALVFQTAPALLFLARFRLALFSLFPL